MLVIIVFETGTFSTDMPPASNELLLFVVPASKARSVSLTRRAESIKEATIDEDTAEASVTGQTVVVIPMAFVTSIVDSASLGKELSAL